LLGVDSMASGSAASLASIEILLAHLFLEVLLKAGFVSKLSVAVGALEGAIVTTVGCLHVVVQEPLLGEVLATGDANKRPLPGVHPVVHVEVALAGVCLGADGADKGLLPGVHPDVFLEAVVVVARLLA
jgi:hypothetical protein